MNLSRKWLADFTKINATPKEFEAAMTLSGSKVELTHDPSAEIKNVVVGLVAAIERHPDSDHLWVCSIDVGAAEPVQIVTGAQNVKQGDIIPVALHKSLLPGGKKIEKGKLRGVKSEGMLCSLSELNLDLHDFPDAVEDGILILTETDGLKPGDDIKAVIGADDSIVEFEITNNRADCFSVIGLAREAAVTFGTELSIHEPVVKGGGGDINSQLKIEINDAELCPRYTAKMVKNIKIEPSPKWMRQRLRAAGVRPINNIVDITNYVMLEYGQPMHAFDYACIDGGKIVVRRAKDGEIMKTLDGTPRELTTDMLVIADAIKPVGVAGVMGGENSEITENTHFAVFESATFEGVSIRKTATALGMRTDASSRFEKGLDTENTLPAVLRACELVEQLGAGEVLDGVIDVYAKPYIPTVLDLQPQRINALLGTDISAEFMVKTLRNLGFRVESETVTVPSWRGDVAHYTDLAEEVARFYGYNVIEPTMFKGDVTSLTGGLTEKQALERKISELARGLGYSEIYTYSFIGTSDYDKIGMPQDAKERNSVRILNPLGEDKAIMRTTPLPSMLETLARNRGYRNENVRLFELAKVYPPVEGEELPEESVVLTLGVYGNADFYLVKGELETILRALRVKNISFIADATIKTFHPGRSALIYSGDTFIGIIGQIHPQIAKEYGLPETYASELELNAIIQTRETEQKYKALPRFPSIERDLAVVCDNEVTAAALTECIAKSGGGLLAEVTLFDVYTGAPIPEGKKSLAFSLKLRADDRTLTDEEADTVMKTVLAALESTYNAVIR